MSRRPNEAIRCFLYVCIMRVEWTGMYYNNLTAFVSQADLAELEIGILQERGLNNISKIIKACSVPSYQRVNGNVCIYWESLKLSHQSCTLCRLNRLNNYISSALVERDVFFMLRKLILYGFKILSDNMIISVIFKMRPVISLVRTLFVTFRKVQLAFWQLS